jgi:hypothetical protein
MTYNLDGLAVLRGEGGEVPKDLAGLQLLLEHVTEPKFKTRISYARVSSVVPRFRMVKYKKKNVNASDCMDVRYEGKKRQIKNSKVRYFVVKPYFVWIRTYPKRLDPEPN